MADPLLERLRLATLGTYDIAGELGRGGMAVVYVARDLKLERTVAIKVMDPRLSLTHGMAERFLQEARIAARLQHPNVIVVHDVQQSEDIIFFVMGLIEGGSIDELCRQPGSLPIDEARWVLMQAARALAYAHSEGIVHRDVKPANILLNLKGEVILTDFGIAKAVGGDGLTKSGTQIGTPVYMSPEQFSDSPVGPASDQYALGITAYQMLTGAPPFGGELYALIAAHGSKTPVPLRDRRPDCPAFLANAVMRMLEKAPENRWPSLEDLVEVLGANLAMDGGAARKRLAAAARDLREARIQSVPALTAITPVSPIPTNSTPQRPAASLPESVMLTISPPAATIFAGGVLELKATVSLDNGDTLPGADVRWSSSNPAVVSVTDSGAIRGVAPGSAMIRATVGDATMDAVICVDLAPLARLVVSTPTLRLRVGDSVQPAVSVFDVTGQHRTDVTLAWQSDTSAVIDADSSGLLRALHPGQGTVEVSVGGLRRRIEVNVERRPIALLRIRSASASLELGEAAALTLEAFDDRGQQVVPPPARWSSDRPSAVHVDSLGTALAIAPGAATITAAVDDASDSIRLEATESPIGTIEVQVAETDLLVGETVVLMVRVLDAFGTERSATGVQIVSQSSEVVRVDPTTFGIEAIGAGDAVLLVSAQPPIASAAIERRLQLQVSPRRTMRLEATPPVLDVMLGDLATITVRALDRRGREIPEAIVHWESDAPNVALVAPTGAVRTLHPGSALLHASCANDDGSFAELRIPVRVRVANASPALSTASLQGPTPSQLEAAAPETPATPIAATPVAATPVAAAAKPRAANRTPLFAGVAITAVTLLAWLARPTGADRQEGPDARTDAGQLPAPAPPPVSVNSPPQASFVTPAPPPVTAPAFDTATAASPPAPDSRAASSPNRAERGGTVPKQSAVTSPRRGSVADAPPGSGTQALAPLPPSAAPYPAAAAGAGAPVAAEPGAEVPTPSELQREVDRSVQELLQTRGAGTLIADFWKDGGGHKVEVGGPTRIISESGRVTQAQFTVRLIKINSGGRRDRYTSQGTLDVTKKNGQVSAATATFLALVSSK